MNRTTFANRAEPSAEDSEQWCGSGCFAGASGRRQSGGRARRPSRPWRVRCSWLPPWASPPARHADAVSREASFPCSIRVRFATVNEATELIDSLSIDGANTLKLITQGEGIGRLHGDTPLPGESLADKALLRRTAAAEYFRMHQENVLKIGGLALGAPGRAGRPSVCLASPYCRHGRPARTPMPTPEPACRRPSAP